MKEVKLALILIISIFLLSGCFGGEFGEDVFSGISGETYQVSGKITNLQEAPVENVKINIDGQVTYTDTSGFYSLEEVGAGNADVELVSDDYRNIDTVRGIYSDTAMDFVMVENQVVYAGRTLGDTSGYIQLKRPEGTGWEYEIYLETLDGENFDQVISFIGGNYSITDEYTYFIAETDNQETRYLMGIADRENITMAGLTESQFTSFMEEYKDLGLGQPQIDFINDNIDQGNVLEGETVFFDRLDNEDLEYNFIAEGILNESNYGLVDGEWSLYRYGNKRFDPEISYTLENNDGESHNYNFIDHSGGVSSNGDDGFEFALDLMETNSDQSYFVYGWSDDSIIEIAVIEKNDSSRETFNNVFVEDPEILRNNIKNIIDNSENKLHTVFGEVK